MRKEHSKCKIINKVDQRNNQGQHKVSLLTLAQVNRDLRLPLVHQQRVVQLHEAQQQNQLEVDKL